VSCRSTALDEESFMGFNATWWMALVWLLVILLAVYPLPWWW
jgi:hypothetical protein